MDAAHFLLPGWHRQRLGRNVVLHSACFVHEYLGPDRSPPFDLENERVKASVLED
jgi:hypothetical protein